MATATPKNRNGVVDERTKPPFLRRVRIRNYKSIGFCDVELHPLTILVGRNASGKSNFVDALAFLSDALSTSVAEAARLHGGTEAFLNRQAKSPVCEIGIETVFPSYRMTCRAE